jgi:hypothetical protein
VAPPPKDDKNHLKTLISPLIGCYQNSHRFEEKLKMLKKFAFRVLNAIKNSVKVPLNSMNVWTVCI